MGNRLMSFVRNWWHYFIGFAIFAYLLTRINISATVAAISSANLLLVAVAFLLVIPMFILKVLRWQYMMRQQGIAYGLKDSVSMYFAAMYLGFVTPGRVAELLKAAYMMKDGHSFGKSFFSVFFDRLADLLFLALVGYVGLFFFPSLFKQQTLWLIMLAAAAAAMTLVLIIKKEFVKLLLQGLLRRIAPSKHKDAVHAHVEDFYSSLKIFSLKSTAVVALLTVLSYLVYFAVTILLAESMEINVNYFFVIISVCIAALVTIIPVSIAGVGTRDASLLIMLGSLGVAKETVIAYSTLNLLANLFLIAVCAPFWFRKPIRF